MGTRASAILYPAVLFFFLAGSPAMGQVSLTRTGQTWSLAAGDDGNLQAGVAWPSPRFTQHGDGTITDNLTGLMWLADMSCLWAHTWADALGEVALLNTNPEETACSGPAESYTDWRLPNLLEMESLVNIQEMVQADWLASQGFTGVQEAFTWSSTTYGSDTDQAWAMDLSSGGILPWPKSTLLWVWAVRAGATGLADPAYPANVWKTGQTTSYASGDDGALQRGVSWPSPRLTVNGDGTLTDNLTGLTWLQDVQCLSGFNWYDTLDRVATLNQGPAGLACSGYTAAHTDWRLPNRQELLSLLDLGQAETSWPINSPFVHGEDVPSGRFWTSSTDPFFGNWFLGIDLGSDPASGPGHFNSGYSGVAVRGGGATCSYSISPAAVSFGYAGGNGSTALTASAGSCGWTIRQRVSWVVPVGPTNPGSSNNGSGTVEYTVQTNPTTQPRTGTLEISGKLLTVTQEGAPCAFTLSPSGQTFGAAGGLAGFQVDVPGSDCAWTAASNDPWITLDWVSSGPGKGRVRYIVDANPGSAPRSGSLTVAGQTFAVTQLASGIAGDVWTPLEPLPAVRANLGAAAAGGRVYAVGGGVNSASSSIESYDPGIGIWSVRTTMSTGRSGLGVVELGGRIYALSGGNGSGLNNPTVESYDPGTDSWSSRASMATGRRAFAAAAANGRIYAFGGCDAACNALSSVEEYDPATDSWAARAPLPTPRRGAAAAAVNGKIYVIGGCPASCSPLGTVEEYDPATDSWTARAPMPTPRSSLAAVALGGRIYALGGLSGSTTLATVEVYDPATDSWSTAAPLVTARRSFGAAVEGGRIYAVGGLTGPGLTQTASLEQYTPRPAVSIDGVAVTEWDAGSIAATFTLSLSEASGEEVTVQVATEDGTATAGEDYAAASAAVTFAPGTTTRTFTVTVQGDTAVEPDETFSARLSNPGHALLGAERTGTGTILDDDASSAAGFDLYTLTPCRVLDTRSGSALASGAVSTFQVAGSCGIPAGARAVVLSVTVVSPTGNGNVALFPGGLTPPATSTINFQAGLNRANNAVLALAPDGAGTLGVRAFVAGNGQVHLLLDVTGWFQ